MQIKYAGEIKAGRFLDTIVHPGFLAEPEQVQTNDLWLVSEPHS